MPNGESLTLNRRGEEYSLRVSNLELMNSRQHGSEEQLAALALGALPTLAGARVLIGGLGMGFTLRAALDALPNDAQVTVAELVPEVVAWHADHLGRLAGEPLDDPRVSVKVADVAELLRARREPFDAILLDTDNGPEGTTQDGNEWLYSASGLAAAKGALRPGGVLAVWSVFSSEAFSRRLKRAGFEVDVRHVRSRGKKGNRHVIWIGRT